MSDLVSSGVALSDKVAQTTKIRSLTDEEFASYKDELISLRKAVEAELAKAAEVESKKTEEEKAKEAAAVEAAAAAAAAAEEKKDAGEGDIPPPEVDPKKAAVAALNLEVKNIDIMSKYAEMGKALAGLMTAKK